MSVGGGAGLEADVEVARNGFTVRAGISVPAGGRLTILGPNGAGKSTLLGALAGNVPMAGGRIVLGGRILDGPGARRAAPAERRITLLDQKPRLFPHLSIRGNVEFGPRAQGATARAARGTADEWLERFGLADRAGERPHELSGGQQQRVAIARAFAAAPELLLLDEPFAALDAASIPVVRRVLTEELVRTRTTSLLVTHDLADAWQWSDRCVVLDRGTVIADSSPSELAERPQHPFTAALVGFGVVHGVWNGDGLDTGGATLAAEPGGELAPGDAAFGVVEPRRVRVVADDAAGAVAGTVDAVSVHAGVLRVTHSSGLIAEVDPKDASRSGRIPACGDELRLRPERLRVRRVPDSPIDP